MIEAGVPDGLHLDADGTPQTPIRRVDLDDWRGAEPRHIAATAADFRRSSALLVGVTSDALNSDLRPLREAMTLTLTEAGEAADQQEIVQVDSPEASFEELVEVVSRRPQTSIALGQLLRQTCHLDAVPAFAAEAAVYSMLLGGTEFAEWLSSRRPPGPPGPSAEDLVQVDRNAGALRILLDQPERRNPLSFAMREELVAALEVAVYDSTVDEVRLAGAGRVFCSGGDLAEFGTARDLVAAYLVRLDRGPWRLLDQLRDRLGAQLVIDVNGAAVGAGAELAAFGGWVRCTPDATFRLPEVSMGLVPGAGGTISIPRRIGRWRSAWIMLSGTTIDADRALAWGLADEIASPGLPQ